LVRRPKNPCWNAPEKQRELIWRAFELTGDENSFKKDIERFNNETRALEGCKAELEQNIDSYQNHEIDAKRVKEACKLYMDNLQNMTYEDKRLALEALQIKTVVEGDKIVVNGIIPMASLEIVSSASSISVV
jgi:seryl-tRNA synthetase